MFDVLARFLWFVSILINEDLPTLDLPINAYSGNFSCGHLFTFVLLIANVAVFIFKIINVYLAFNDEVFVKVLMVKKLTAPIAHINGAFWLL